MVEKECLNNLQDLDTRRCPSERNVALELLERRVVGRQVEEYRGQILDPRQLILIWTLKKIVVFFLCHICC